MSDMIDMYRDMKEIDQERRADNRETSAAHLRVCGVQFEARNDGAHLIITRQRKAVIDFWPGTGKWIERNGKKGHGIKSLCALLAIAQPKSKD